jgi:hypothetical protein
MTGSSVGVRPEQLWVTALMLVVDGVTAEVTRALNARGVDCILLKGPAVARWLYDKEEIRPYGDTDLLIPPESWDTAREVLMQLGFRDALGPMAHPRMESFASYPWHRGRDNVDLHATIWGIHVPVEQVWPILSRDTETIGVGGVEIPVMSEPLRVLHVAIHAAQHEGVTKSGEDLRRAIARCSQETWRATAQVADELRATDVLVAGLRVVPEGRLVLEELGLAEASSGGAALRGSHVPLAEGFEQLSRAPGVRAKAEMLVHEAFPTAVFMRWWSPLARRGRRGLYASYAVRAGWLAAHAPRGYLAWRRSRRPPR